MRPICLDHLSLIDLSALQLIEVAGELGCARVSLMVGAVPLNPALDLLEDRTARIAVLRALRNSGLRVGIVEPFLLDDAPNWELMQRTADLAAELGGTINGLGFDSQPARLQESVSRLAQLARAAGVPMTLEAFPLSALRTQAEALAYAQAAGIEVGLCVDTLHVMRAGGSWDDVAKLPSTRIFHVQLNDGPRQAPQDRYAEAVGARLPPGEGEFDLPALLPLLPQSATLAVEAPFRAPPELTPLERGRVLVNATRRLLDGYVSQQ